MRAHAVPGIAPAVAAGLLSAFVGFASSFAVVLRGLSAVGATPAQAASGLMALSIAMGVGGVWLSLRGRMPVSVAWSLGEQDGTRARRLEYAIKQLTRAQKLRLIRGDAAPPVLPERTGRSRVAPAKKRC